jgi:hypothetical protein
MKREVFVLALLGWALTSTGRADYIIDGSLSDWGVTPFSDWSPGQPSADFTATDNVNLYQAYSYSEGYDFEAMYFDDSAESFFFAVVTSHALGALSASGDLGLDLNGDMTISEHGIVTGLEYAMHVGNGTLGEVVYDPTWERTQLQDWPDGWQGSPYKASGGTVVGSAAVAIAYYPGMEFGTYILEAAVPRNLFPDGGGNIGDLVGSHLTIWCGNDSINLVGDIDTNTEVPVPGASLLSCCGVGLIALLRRYRTGNREGKACAKWPGAPRRRSARG